MYPNLEAEMARHKITTKDVAKVIERSESEVTDIRDGLKAFTGRYLKSKKTVEDSDCQQNEYFCNKLRFSFTKRLNIHLNLRVYFNDQGKVVFDTQLANYFLNISKRG